jgi:hypothetical protein
MPDWEIPGRRGCLRSVLSLLTAGIVAGVAFSACGNGVPGGNGGGMIPAASAATSPPLVWVCPNLQAGSATLTCHAPGGSGDISEFEIFDGYGNPICAVAPYGGLACFGDNIQVFPPGDVFHANITLNDDGGQNGHPNGTITVSGQTLTAADIAELHLLEKAHVTMADLRWLAKHG